MAVQGTVIRRPWTQKAAALVLVGAGAVLMKLCVVDVLSAAHAGTEVSLSFKGVLLAPPALFWLRSQLAALGYDV